MRFEFHHGFQCWSLRRYADVQAALRDPRRFAMSLTPDFDEAAHTRVLRQAMEAVDIAPWRQALESIPVAADARELVRGFAEPWAHEAAMRLVGVSRQPDRLLELARAAYAAGASPMDPALREPADLAARELAAVLPAALGPLTVQAFIATSQTLAAFLSNAIVTMLGSSADFELEDLFRIAGPAQAQFRYAAVDSGEVPRGSRVALLLAEANRDREAAGKAHLAFGGGPHACVGAALMRAAAPVALRRFRENYRTAKIESLVWPDGALAILSPLEIRIRELASGELRFQD
jgi:cytochrome P450